MIDPEAGPSQHAFEGVGRGSRVDRSFTGIGSCPGPTLTPWSRWASAALLVLAPAPAMAGLVGSGHQGTVTGWCVARSARDIGSRVRCVSDGCQGLCRASAHRAGGNKSSGGRRAAQLTSHIVRPQQGQVGQAGGRGGRHDPSVQVAERCQSHERAPASPKRMDSAARASTLPPTHHGGIECERPSPSCSRAAAPRRCRC